MTPLRSAHPRGAPCAPSATPKRCAMELLPPQALSFGMSPHQAPGFWGDAQLSPPSVAVSTRNNRVRLAGRRSLPTSEEQMKPNDLEAAARRERVLHLLQKHSNYTQSPSSPLDLAEVKALPPELKPALTQIEEHSEEPLLQTRAQSPLRASPSVAMAMRSPSPTPEPRAQHNSSPLPSPGSPTQHRASFHAASSPQPSALRHPSPVSASASRHSLPQPSPPPPPKVLPPPSPTKVQSDEASQTGDFSEPPPALLPNVPSEQPWWSPFLSSVLSSMGFGEVSEEVKQRHMSTELSVHEDPSRQPSLMSYGDNDSRGRSTRSTNFSGTHSGRGSSDMSSLPSFMSPKKPPRLLGGSYIFSPAAQLPLSTRAKQKPLDETRPQSDYHELKDEAALRAAAEIPAAPQPEKPSPTKKPPSTPLPERPFMTPKTQRLKHLDRGAVTLPGGRMPAVSERNLLLQQTTTQMHELWADVEVIHDHYLSALGRPPTRQVQLGEASMEAQILSDRHRKATFNRLAERRRVKAASSINLAKPVARGTGYEQPHPAQRAPIPVHHPVQASVPVHHQL